MNILLLGGSGHVSGTLARAALDAGHAVWAVTRGQRTLADGVHPLIADRHDDAALAAALSAAGVAWELAVDCIGYDLPDIRQDIALLRDRAAQFVFISTDFVYDPASRRVPQPEEAVAWEMVEDYGRQKRRCEEALLASDWCTWTVVRPCHIYGPSSELGCLPRHGRDPELIATLRAGQPLQLVGGGYFLQQPLLADDLARAILSVAGNPRALRQIFNVAGPDIIESRDYYRIIAETLGVALHVEEVPVDAYRAAHPEAAPFLCHRIPDLHALAACGLAVPATPIEAGLRYHVEGLRRRKGLA